jgi:hypothetical protein
MQQLLPATADGVWTQSRDVGQFGKAASPLLPSQKGDIEPSALFVEGSNQLVDQMMFGGNLTLRVELTIRTATLMNAWMNGFCHE